MKNILKIIKYFKSIFRGAIKKCDYNINDNKEITLIESVDVVSSEKVELTKEEVKENIQNLNIRWDFINSLKDYDIVWVKMTNEEIRSQKISDEHQKRPFLIRSKDDKNKIINGYYLTGNISNHWFFKREKYKGLRLVLNKDNYNFRKNDLVLYNKEVKLPYENVIRLLSHITSDDLNRLNKYINLLNGNMVISNIDNNVVEIGDVVLGENDSRYIIYQVDNNNCYGYGLKKHSNNIRVHLEDNPNYILFDNKFYYIDYNDTKIFSKHSNIYVINRFNDDVVEMIKENKKKLKIKMKKLNKK